MDEAAAAPQEDGDEKVASKDVLAEAKERFKIAEEYWGPHHTAWREDAEFRDLKQWPANVVALRGDERPCPVVDKCNQYVRQVVNDGRQNRPAVKVRPVDDSGDDEVADAFQGIIRHICDRSNADEAFDTALDHAAGNGFGYFRVNMEYAHRGTPLKDLAVLRIRNPLDVYLDPAARAADGSDAEWGFYVSELPKDKFKSQYPQAKFTNWDSDSTRYGKGWLADEVVRFAEYWYKEHGTRTMHFLDDGTTVYDEDYQLKLANPIDGEVVPAITKTWTDIPSVTVKWCRLSGAEILEEKDWLGEYIPLIPVYGNESDVGGKVTYSGLIRAAKDAQRLYNYMAASFVEVVALTPKAPFVAAEGQLEGYEGEWETANEGNKAVLVYKPVSIDGATALPAPQRQQPGSVPAGYAQAMQHMEHDIQASMGMYNASIGEKSNEKSGRAIMARQREGDTATFHYQDNLNRAIRHLGRILVDLIPKVYDSRRVVRILGEDGDAEAATVDPQQTEAVRKINGGQTIYNLSVGTYDVSVSAGPSYTTKRQESAEMMRDLIQANPQVMQFAGDLFIRALDMPYGDELADRFKLMLPPQIAEAEKNKGQQSPEVMAIKAQAQQALDAASQQIQAAEQGIAERDQALAELTSKVQGFEDQQRAQAEKGQVLAVQAKVEQSAADLAAAEQVRQEKARADAAEFELKRQEALHALEELQEQTVEQIKALLVPTPSVEQPEAAPPPGPSPELAAILEHLQNQSEVIMQGFAHLTRPKVATLPDGRQITVA